MQSRERDLNQKEQRLNEPEKALGLLEQDLNDRLRKSRANASGWKNWGPAGKIAPGAEGPEKRPHRASGGRLQIHAAERAGAWSTAWTSRWRCRYGRLPAAMSARSCLHRPDKAARLPKAISELKKTQAPPPSGDAGTAADNAPAAADDAAAIPDRPARLPSDRARKGSSFSGIRNGKPCRFTADRPPPLFIFVKVTWTFFIRYIKTLGKNCPRPDVRNAPPKRLSIYRTDYT